MEPNETEKQTDTQTGEQNVDLKKENVDLKKEIEEKDREIKELRDMVADEKLKNLKNMNKNEDGEVQERIDRLENNMKEKEYREGKGKNVDFNKVKEIKEEEGVSWETAHKIHIGNLAVEDVTYTERLQSPNYETGNNQKVMTKEELRDAAAEASTRL